MKMMQKRLINISLQVFFPIFPYFPRENFEVFPEILVSLYFPLQAFKAENCGTVDMKICPYETKYMYK
jgi:hypothetical protein